ncbi:MAG: hypothetical protein KGZ54_11370 [Dethiobacter sp.]|jgi:hypothetical protein|nr:hypothetical protein [Dethiobacter sp.]
MRGEALWCKVISGLSIKGEKQQTTTGLWFRPSSQGGKLYIDRATENMPFSKLSLQRQEIK